MVAVITAIFSTGCLKREFLNMKASEAKAMSWITINRDSKTALLMYCLKEIATMALQGNWQTTIDLVNFVGGVDPDIGTIMSQLKSRGYSVFKTGETRLYVSWEGA